VGVFAVLPLWLLYEGLRLFLAPEERNGAEALINDSLRLFGPHALSVLRVAMLITILLAAWSLLRREVPWGRVVLVSLLEGAVYGLMLGPVTGALTLQFFHDARPLAAGLQSQDLIGSLGAGIFEEALFRLGLLSLLALVFHRVCRAFSMPVALGSCAAVLVSAILFSLFHHVGTGGDPFDLRFFVFRTLAGLILGTLFVLRGFGVCVYTHSVYDLHYYLTT